MCKANGPRIHVHGQRPTDSCARPTAHGFMCTADGPQIHVHGQRPTDSCARPTAHGFICKANGPRIHMHSRWLRLGVIGRRSPSVPAGAYPSLHPKDLGDVGAAGNAGLRADLVAHCPQLIDDGLSD